MVTNITHNPQDMTGRKKAELAAQHAEEQEQKAQSMSMMTAKAASDALEVIDVSGPDVVNVGDAEVRVPKVKMRVNTDLESVTIGHGTAYDFKANGQHYRVSEDVYDYLDEKGFVYH